MKESRRKWPLPVRADRETVLPLFERFHGYGGMSGAGEIWAAFENGEAVAAWTWQPPPFGAAKAVCPSFSQAVLSLSRMVAVPKAERTWHLSKPLRWLMRHGIDRSRYPVLVTWSDEGEGHSGHVYVCSGWVRDGSRVSRRYEDAQGVRRSIRTNGGQKKEGLTFVGESLITRWTHRICHSGTEHGFISENGWRAVSTGRVWRSGKPAVRYEKEEQL